MTSTLSQTTEIDRLLGRARSEMSEGRVPVEIFNSDVVFALEQERLFQRAWLFLAH